MKKQPLLVEFVGLPGAGKTTIAQAVVAELASVGYHCFSLSTTSTPEAVEKKKGNLFEKLETFYELIFACIVYSRIARRALAYALHIKPVNFSNLRRLVVLIVRLSFVGKLLKSNYDNIILDQGIFQNIWSMTIAGEAPIADSYLTQLVQEILQEYSPIVIWIDADVEIATKRIGDRPTLRSRFDRMSASLAKERLAKHQDIFMQIFSKIENSSAVESLRVDGSQAVNQSVAEVVVFLECARKNKGLRLANSI